MSSTDTKDRTKALLLRFDEAIKANQPQKAAEALREASHLDSNSPEVKERWTKLHRLDSGGDVLVSLRTYVGSQKDEDGQNALRELKAKQLSANDAVQAVELLWRVSSAPKLLDSLTSTLMSRNVEARKFVATKLSESATETFELLFERGEESFNVLATIPLDDSLWKPEDSQATAQRDLFRLSVATLIEAGAEHLERVMRCISRLLTIAPDNVKSLIDEDVVDAILSSLDSRLSASLRHQAMMATSKLLEVTQQRGEELFSQFIMDRAEKQTNDDMIIAFSAAAAVFPVIPAVAARLFLTDGFVQQLVPNLERNSEDGAAGKR